MTEITLDQALKLVTFKHDNGRWVVDNVGGNVYGDVYGDVYGHVYGHVGGQVCGNVCGNVRGNVRGNVGGDVRGTINGRRWQFVETPVEKVRRLIEADAPKDQVLAALAQVQPSETFNAE